MSLAFDRTAQDEGVATGLRLEAGRAYFEWQLYAIIHVLNCVFLIFRDFQFSCHIPRPTVDISKFSTFSFFLAIFHVLKCIFLILREFQ